MVIGEQLLMPFELSTCLLKERDVFPTLVQTKGWNAAQRNVCQEDIVIVQTENSKRGKWTIGRVLKVLPKADGKVHRVKMKTSAGMYHRPITKIAVINTVDGYEG